MQGRSERLARQLERRACERGAAPAGREATKDESRLRRAQLRSESLLRVKGLAGAEQLERDSAAGRTRRHEEKLRGARALRDPAHRGGGLGELDERRGGEILHGQDGPFQFGRERLGRRDGHGLEPLAALVESANERDLGACRGSGGIRQRPQRLGRARRDGRSGNRPHEGSERRSR